MRQFRILAAAASIAAVIGASAAGAQVYDGSSFIGLPVFAVDGTEVGEVVSEGYGADGAPSVLRISVGQPLGLGEKIIEISRERYVGLRGAVTLDTPAEDIRALPGAEN